MDPEKDRPFNNYDTPCNDEVRADLVEQLWTCAEAWTKLNSEYTAIVGSYVDPVDSSRIGATMAFMKSGNDINVQLIEIDILTQRPNNSLIQFKLKQGGIISEEELSLRDLQIASSIANPLMPRTRQIGYVQFEKWLK